MENNTLNHSTKNTETLYSMHTMTISAHLTTMDKNILKVCLDDYTDDHHLERYTSKRSNQKLKEIQYKGIADRFHFNQVTLKSCIPRDTEIKNYWLNIKINPRKLFHHNNYPFTYIASTSEVNACLDQVERMLSAIDAAEISIEMFKIQRIDFCTNIDLGSKEAAEEYLQILLKGTYPKNFTRLTEYSETEKRLIPTKDSFTIRSNNLEFSVYNKYRQLEKEAAKYSPEEIQAANGMIRIELRIKRPGIYQRSKKYQLSDAQEFLEHISHMAGTDIPRYLKKCYGTGNFTTLDHARKLVQNSNYQTKTKEDLLVMLALVNSKRSLHAARETLTPKNYKKCMKKFNELGISPITIPRRSTATTFFNPLHYIKYHNCNYRN